MGLFFQARAAPAADRALESGAFELVLGYNSRATN